MNIIVAKSGKAALQLMQGFDEHVSSKWGLHFKAGSQLLMQPRGSAEVVNLPSHCSGLQVMPVLGHVMANDGAIRPAWTPTHAAMLRAFWKQVRAANGSLTSEQMFQVIDRGVRPVGDWHFSVWPIQRTIAAELDDLQARMYRTVLTEAWLPTHDAATHAQRKAKRARASCVSRGTWSTRWSKRFVALSEYFTRHALHPANALFRYHDAAWLQKRRMMFSLSRLLAGRTDTRTHAARVQVRWETAIPLARQWQSGTPPP